MKVYNHKDAYIHLNYLLKSQQEDFFIAIFDNTSVHYGEDCSFNFEAAVEKNILCYNIKRKGGAIVASPEDVVYCFTSKKEHSDFDVQ